jgi:hypothetical protein
VLPLTTVKDHKLKPQPQVTNGVVTAITVNNGGQGYVAPPKVQILGDGAGAEAIVTSVGNGQIGAITVTNGGSGYLPMQYQGTNKPGVD